LENLFISLLLYQFVSFVVGVVSQFMKNPCIDHWNVVIHIPRYLKKSRTKATL